MFSFFLSLRQIHPHELYISVFFRFKRKSLFHFTSMFKSSFFRVILWKNWIIRNWSLCTVFISVECPAILQWKWKTSPVTVDDNMVYLSTIFWLLISAQTTFIRVNVYFYEIWSGGANIPHYLSWTLLWKSRLKLHSQFVRPGADRSPVPHVYCWHLV